jgi:hypothetical protein
MKQLFVLALIVMIASAQSESPGTRCVLVAGVGCGELILNKTRHSDFLADAEAEKRYATASPSLSLSGQTRCWTR